MKKVTGVFVAAIILVAVCSFITKKKPAEPAMKWMTWAEVQAAQKKEPRKIFVDVYTDWCGWCKRMDATTFGHPDIAKFMNENFYAVKFNAEDRTTINFKGKDYKYVASGYRGYNELAAEILSGQMSYPTSVYLDEDLNLLFPVPGYLEPKTFEQVVNYVYSNSYKNMKWDDYAKNFKGKIQ